MSEKIVYLDNNATTKTCQEAIDNMIPFFAEQYGNPSSMHDFGGEVAQYLKKARKQVAELIGAADPNEVIFTSCGTESSNMAIRGLTDPHKKHIITTKVEHPCVLNVTKHLEKNHGYEVTYLGVNAEGELDLEEFKDSIRDDTALIAIMWANNETGVIFPVEKMAEIAKEKNPKVLFFVDAVQAAGKIPVDVKNTKIDMLGISGHKIHAPKGVGAIYIRKGTLITPFMLGGHQERGKRGGTENVSGIVALGEAAEQALNYLDDEATRVKAMRDKLEKGILSKLFNARVNGSRLHRVPNTTNISFEYIEGELILLHLSDLGICASSGSACTSGNLEPSHVLRAMGVPFTAVHGSIRFSLSRYTSNEEIDYVLKQLPDVIHKLNAISPFQKELKELKEIKESAKALKCALGDKRCCEQ
ncbi:MAG: cysteine desulfurase NifS [Candidatus Melainabacteria bacterium GWF2_37_15]|nr:MAG: cysteine desulfurase NifS [Candidatus Melainabacteria bacterium GWF2_37_15]